jgi:hypothetical protein
MQTSAVAAASLVLDVAGAITLASAVFLRRASQALEEALPKYDFNADLHGGLARQTADAQAGTFLLVLGFVGQLVSATGWNPTGTCAWIAGGAADCAVITVVLIVLFRVLRPKQLRAALVGQLARNDVSQWWLVLREYGAQLGRRRNVGETPEHFGRILLGDRWTRLVENVPERELPENLTKSWHPDHGHDQEDYRAFQA